MIRVETERTVSAQPSVVSAFLSEYRENRPKILPPNYENYAVMNGGRGSGTVITYVLHAGGRQRPYEMHVQQQGDQVIEERDARSSLVTTWRVAPAGTDQSRVTVTTVWQGGSGVGGFFERTFAPGGVRRIYDDMLRRLDQEVATRGTQHVAR